MSTKLLPDWPAAMTRKMAAAYCGLSVKTFLKVCPVKPIALTQSSRGNRYLRQEVDEWLLSIRTKGPPDVFTPEEVAEYFGWSERTLREKARELGACHILGNAMVLLRSDVDAILEAIKPPPLPPKR